MDKCRKGIVAPLGRTSEWGAPLTIIVGAPCSAPGAYLQFGAGAPLAENHYGDFFEKKFFFLIQKKIVYVLKVFDTVPSYDVLEC